MRPWIISAGETASRCFPWTTVTQRVRLDRNSVETGEFPEVARGEAVPDNEAGNLSGWFRRAEEIQDVVRRRVEPHTWEAFWYVGVLLWTVDETAQYLQMSHAGVYKAKARVAKALQAEARRRGWA